MRTEREKCSTSSRKFQHIDLVEIMSVLQERTTRAKTQIEASTEHTSPFCGRQERQNPSPPRRRKCVKFFQSPVLSEAPYPLSNQALRHGQSHLPKNPMFRGPHATPRHREKAARYKKQKNNAPFFQCPRGLAHDDVLQLSLHHHNVDKLDLRHLSAPKVGATVGAQCPSSAKTNPVQCPDAPTHAHCRRPSQCTHPGSKADCSEPFDERSVWMD